MCSALTDSRPPMLRSEAVRMSGFGESRYSYRTREWKHGLRSCNNGKVGTLSKGEREGKACVNQEGGRRQTADGRMNESQRADVVMATLGRCKVSLGADGTFRTAPPLVRDQFLDSHVPTQCSV